MLRTLVNSRARQCALSSVAARSFSGSAATRALTKFTFPAMSPTMTEGGIASWKKGEGDSFAPGDVLLEIETDKATMDVEAQDEGILAKILVGDGSKAIPVGKIVAIMAEEGDDVSESAVNKLVEEGAADSAKEEPKKVSEPKDEKPQEKETKKQATTPAPKSDNSPKSASGETSSQPSSERKTILASPIAKRLALEKGIPIGEISGSGPNGRIIKQDIENYKPSAAPSQSAAAPSSAPTASKASQAAPTAQTAAYTDTPVSNMRRTIATRLTESKSGTPHYYLTAEINMDRVTKLRQVFNQAAKAAEAAGGVSEGVKTGTKLSVNDFIIKASALALQDVPEVNSGWHGDFVRQYHKQDISVAVATPNGLITPIVTDCGGKGLASISAATKQLAAKARDGKLKPEEYQGGSFTISNLGMMGVESFTAIINPPQSCILAIGATESKLVLDASSEKGFKEVKVMKVTVSCDHRVVDGAIGARWLKAFKSYLESPLSFML